MKNKLSQLLIVTFFIILVSCSVSNKVTYLSNSGNISNVCLNSDSLTHEIILAPKDILTISVNTSVPEVSAPFNIGSSAGSGFQMQGGIMGAELQTYIISPDGFIIFPVVGKIKAAGLTRSELQEKIILEIYPRFIKEIPIINVRLKNFKIAVLGEVNRPGSYTINDEKCTIFDALALAGDLTIYGKRENVKILRDGKNGVKEILTIDLQNIELLNVNEKYYLKQNDVIYIEPNKAKSRAAGIGSAETYTISIVSTLISIATLLITIFR